MEQITKRCPRCERIKPISDFRSEPSRPRGVATYCRACEPTIRRAKYLARKAAHNAAAMAYQRARPAKRAEWARRHALKRLYCMTPEDWDVMLAAQDGACAICRQPAGLGSRRLDVDHDHDTGEVRGLLCIGCNSGIAHLGHDAARLQLAITYLNREVQCSR